MNLRVESATAARRSMLSRYGFAVAVTMLAGVGRLLFDPLFGTRLAFLTFFPAVMLSSWFGGLSAGLVSTALSAIVADYFWFEPLHTFKLTNLGDVVALFVFVATGVVISVLNESLHRGAAREEAARLAAEEAQRRAQSSEHRLGSLIQAVPNAIVAVDKGGHIVFVNAVAERLFGYGRDELVGQSIERLVPQRFRDRHLHYRDGFTRDPLARPMGVGRDLFGLRKDGTEIPIEVGLNPVRIDDDVLVLSSIVDITERTRLLQREQQARAEAVAANQSKDVFIARVSHELRTPLNALMGWARMLRDSQLPPDKLQQGIATIDRNAEVLQTLVEDLVEMSRVATGKLQLDRHPLDITALVRESSYLLEPAAREKHIRIDTNAEARTIVVDGDAKRLRQVVWNLLSNAIRFTPPNGTVTLRVFLTGDEVRIEVTDTGQGIASEFLPRVFEPFSQATTDGHGLGLGLAIVRQLVEGHGGRINASSPGVGAGATFTVTLPVVRTTEAV